MIHIVFPQNRDTNPKEIRICKVLEGIVYGVIGFIAMKLMQTNEEMVYVYSMLFGFIFSLGSILSAINTNLRRMYSDVFICGFSCWAFYVWLYENYKIITIIICVMIIGATFYGFQEYIKNMKLGIDPDVEEEKKSRRRKIGFKVLKFAFKIFK